VKVGRCRVYWGLRARSYRQLRKTALRVPSCFVLFTKYSDDKMKDRFGTCGEKINLYLKERDHFEWLG